MDFADTSIVISEPYFNFTSIQESMNEILFEEYRFQSALRINGEYGTRLAAARQPDADGGMRAVPSLLVSGFSQCSRILPLGTFPAVLPPGGQRLLLHTYRPLLPWQQNEGRHPQVKARNNGSAIRDIISVAVGGIELVLTSESGWIIRGGAVMLTCHPPSFRINVGGKLLTNHLKEIISYR